MTGPVVPRSMCSGTYSLDSLWCSKAIAVTTIQEKENYIRSQCKLLWSPGMVLFIARGMVSLKMLQSLVADFLSLGHRFGKARRISLGDQIPSQLIQQLYQCFYCVEHTCEDARVTILDDGNETATIARIV